MEKILEEIKNYRLVPVVAIKNIEDAIPTMEALINGGLPVAEITYRTSCAKDAIKACVEKFPNALIGAGTVINESQAEEAISLGVKFIVSPGLSEKVAAVCKKHGVPYLPGCVTPTEIMKALDLGLTTIKFFPASNYGGVKTIKALSGPFPQITIMPTGGVNEDNVMEYLACKNIIACGGSFMMKGSFEEIEEKTRQAMKLVKGE